MSIDAYISYTYAPEMNSKNQIYNFLDKFIDKCIYMCIFLEVKNLAGSRIGNCRSSISKSIGDQGLAILKVSGIGNPKSIRDWQS